MIFSKFKYPAVFFAAAFLLNSCAQEPSESSRASELRLLSSTKEMYFPNATQLGGYTDGSLWLISHSQVGSGATPQNGNYVAFEYTAKQLPISGSKIIQSTDSTIARQLGVYAATTHFVPIFMQDTTANTQTIALHEVLKIMSVGDTATLMCASWLATYPSLTTLTTKDNSLSSVPSGTPIIFTVVLKEVVTNPKERELNMVKEYVAAHPEKEFVLAKDNEGNELSGFYISYKDTVPLQDSAFYAATDDSVHVKYAGYYLEDNFLLDTNIDSVAKKYSWTITTTDSTYYRYVFSETAEYVAVIPAFHYALLRVAAGSWIEVVFTSDYGYGAVGSNLVDNRPVYRYTPLRYRIYVAKITAN